MLKITFSENEKHGMRLTVDGTVDCDAIAEIEACCSRAHLGARNLIVLDMSGVDFMTAPAARRLAVLCGARLRLVNCSPFIETLLRVCQP